MRLFDLGYVPTALKAAPEPSWQPPLTFRSRLSVSVYSKKQKNNPQQQETPLQFVTGQIPFL
jgi:hypothetical protein